MSLLHCSHSSFSENSITLLQDETFIPSLWPVNVGENLINSDSLENPASEASAATSRTDDDAGLNTIVAVDDIEKNEGSDSREGKVLQGQRSTAASSIDYVSGFVPSEYFPSHRRIGKAVFPPRHKKSAVRSGRSGRVHFEAQDAVLNPYRLALSNENSQAQRQSRDLVEESPASPELTERKPQNIGLPPVPEYQTRFSPRGPFIAASASSHLARRIGEAREVGEVQVLRAHSSSKSEDARRSRSRSKSVWDKFLDTLQF